MSYLWVMGCTVCLIVGTYLGHAVKDSDLADSMNIFWLGAMCGAALMILIAALTGA